LHPCDSVARLYFRLLSCQGYLKNWIETNPCAEELIKIIHHEIPRMYRERL
jgi:hypothetical protein